MEEKTITIKREHLEDNRHRFVVIRFSAFDINYLLPMVIKGEKEFFDSAIKHLSGGMKESLGDNCKPQVHLILDRIFNRNVLEKHNALTASKIKIHHMVYPHAETVSGMTEIMVKQMSNEEKRDVSSFSFPNPATVQASFIEKAFNCYPLLHPSPTFSDALFFYYLSDGQSTIMTIDEYLAYMESTEE
ncbi:MAG TPA: hypothetical protein P5077_13110 [bacterium]|nr:hypothetical protein [bacterium]